MKKFSFNAILVFILMAISFALPAIFIDADKVKAEASISNSVQTTYNAGASATIAKDWDTTLAVPDGITHLVISTVIPEGFEKYSETSVADSTSEFPLYFYTSTTETEKLVISGENLEMIYAPTDAQQMFKGLTVSEITFENFNTENTTNFSELFNLCSNLTTINGISDWNVALVKNMMNVFSSTALTTLNLENWNTVSATSMSYMFSGSPIESLDISGFNTSKVTSFYAMFSNCTSLQTITGIENFKFNASYPTLDYMFRGVGIKSLNLNNWDVSPLNNLNYLFYNCTSLTELKIDQWNTSNIKSLNNTFAGCSALEMLDVSSWDVSAVKDFSYTFLNCAQLTDFNLGSWNVGSATTMSNMFANCCALTKMDLSSWRPTTSLTNLSGIFSGCSKLTDLDLSGWETSKVTNISYLVFNCEVLETLNLTGWSTACVTASASLFNNAKLLKTIHTPSVTTTISIPLPTYFQYGNVADSTAVRVNTYYTAMPVNLTESVTLKAMYRIIARANGGEVLESEYWSGTGNYATAGVFFDETLSVFPEVKYSGSKLTGWFDSTSETANKIESIVNPTAGKNIYAHWEEVYAYISSSWQTLLSIPDGITDIVVTTTVPEGFEKYSETSVADEISDLPIYFYVSQTEPAKLVIACTDVNTILAPQSLENMFSGLTNIKTITFENFNISNSQNLSSLFANNTSLETVSGIATWDLGSAKNLSAMFDNCIKLNNVGDISEWNISSVTDISKMFADCEKLDVTEYVKGWDISSVLNMSAMFENCLAISTLDLSAWDLSNVNNATDMLKGCLNLTTLKTPNKTGIFVPELPVDMFNENSTRQQRIQNGAYLTIPLNANATETLLRGYNVALDLNGGTLVSSENWSSSGTAYVLVNEQLNLPVALQVGYAFLGWFYGAEEGSEQAYSTDVPTSDLTLNAKWTTPTAVLSNRWQTTQAIPTGITEIIVSTTVPSGFELYSEISVADSTSAAPLYFFTSLTQTSKLVISNYGLEMIYAPQDSSSMFSGLDTITKLTFENFNIENAENLNNMFYHCDALETISGMESWVGENVQTTKSMFQSCYALSSVNLSSWNATNCTNASCMFDSTAVQTVNLSSWKATSLQNMYRMFYAIEELTEIVGIENWEASNVTDMSYAFHMCEGLTGTMDLSGWKATKVTTFQNTFYYTKFEILNLSGWDISLVTNVSNMLYRNTNLKKVITPSKTGSLSISLTGNFYSASSSRVARLSETATNAIPANLTSSIELHRGYAITIYTNGGAFDSTENTDWLIEETQARCCMLWNETYNFPSVSWLGYDHLGWFLSTSSPDEILSTDIYKTSTVYAKWEKIYYTVSFDENGGSEVDDVTFAIDTSRYLSTISTSRPGYAFGGWFITSMDGVIFTASGVEGTVGEKITRIYSGSYGNFAVQAKWTVKTAILDEDWVYDAYYYYKSIDNLNYAFPETITEVRFTSCENIPEDYSYISFSVEADNSENELNIYLSPDKTIMLISGKNVGTIYAPEDIEYLLRPSSTYSIGTDNVFPNLKTVRFENFSTENTTSMEYVFKDFNLLEAVYGLDSWNLSSVTSIEYMFADCQHLTTIEVIANWDVSKVTNMSSMFNDCSSLTELDLSGWKTDSLTNMSMMFSGCESLTEIKGITNLNTSQVTSGLDVFRSTGLKNLDLSGWNVEKLTYMGSMFSYCENLETLNLENWKTTSLTSMQGAFFSSEKLTEIKGIENFNTSKVTTMYQTFYGCRSLKALI